MSIYDYNRYDVYLAKLSNAKGNQTSSGLDWWGV